MQKPFSVAIREFRSGIVELINGSGLPYDAILPTVRELEEVLEAKAEANYRAELEAYNEALAEKAKAEAEAFNEAESEDE